MSSHKIADEREQCVTIFPLTESQSNAATSFALRQTLHSRPATTWILSLRCVTHPLHNGGEFE